MMPSNPTVADRLAEAISYAFTPLLMPAAVTMAVLLDIRSSATEVYLTTSVVLLALFVTPLTDIVSMVRRGKTPSVDVPNHEARTEPLAIAVVAGCAAVLTVRAMNMHGEPLIHVILVTYVINLIVVMGINVGWKISVHMVAAGGSLAVLLIVSGLSGAHSLFLTRSTVLPLFTLLPIVGWARWQLKAHTVAQIVVGAVIGFGGHWLALLAQTAN